VVHIARVIVKQNEELEKAIKRFRKKVDKEGIIREWKKHKYFHKPSFLRHLRKKSRRHKANKKNNKVNKK
jgi:small subunit ribosomal protein S21